MFHSTSRCVATKFGCDSIGAWEHEPYYETENGGALFQSASGGVMQQFDKKLKPNTDLRCSLRVA